MTLATTFKYLFGSKKAILKVASSKSALWLGFFFVLTAGIARNYDQVYLAQEIGHLFHPILASLGSSFFIFFFVYSYDGAEKSKFGDQYLSFLGLFWLTAPLAWLYAIPIETMTDSYNAAIFNLWFLAIVSIWRVCLIARVVSVIKDISFIKSLIIILVPISIIVAPVSYFANLGEAILRGMSGIGSSPEQNLIQETLELLFLSFSGVGIICLVGAFIVKKHIGHSEFPIRETSSLPWISMAVITVFWITIAINPQKKAEHSYKVNKLTDTEKYKEMLRYMSKYKQEDFCVARKFPLYPYDIKFARNYPSTFSNLLLAMDGTEAPWVRKVFFGYLKMFFEMENRSVNSGRMILLAECLHNNPHGSKWIAENMDFIIKSNNTSKTVSEVFKDPDYLKKLEEKKEEREKK